jgi:hypothetical protein
MWALGHRGELPPVLLAVVEDLPRGVLDQDQRCRRAGGQRCRDGMRYADGRVDVALEDLIAFAEDAAKAFLRQRLGATDRHRPDWAPVPSGPSWHSVDLNSPAPLSVPTRANPEGRDQRHNPTPPRHKCCPSWANAGPERPDTPGHSASRPHRPGISRRVCARSGSAAGSPGYLSWHHGLVRGVVSAVPLGQSGFLVQVRRTRRTRRRRSSRIPGAKLAGAAELAPR